MNSIRSVRNPKRQSKNSERSNYLNWKKFLRRYSARPAPSLARRENVEGLRKKRNARQRKNLTPCQICKYAQLQMSVKHEHEHVHDDCITSRLQAPQQKGWRFVTESSSSLCGTPVGPGKDTHGTWGPVRGKAVRARQQVTTRHDQDNDETKFAVSRLTST